MPVILCFFIMWSILTLLAEPAHHQNDKTAESTPVEAPETEHIGLSKEARIYAAKQKREDLARRLEKMLANKDPKSHGVILIFNQWPDSNQEQIIEEYLSKEGMRKTAEFDRVSKMRFYEWPELDLEERALEICDRFPSFSSIDLCESNTVLVPDYWN